MCHTNLNFEKSERSIFTQNVVLEQISKYPANEALKIPQREIPTNSHHLEDSSTCNFFKRREMNIRGQNIFTDKIKVL